MADVTKIDAGANGAAAVAPTGSTAPTDSTTALNAAFKDLGFISEDGLTEAVNQSTNEVKAWDGTVVRKVLTGAEKTFKIKFLESNGNVLDLYYSKPTNAVVGGKTTLTVKPILSRDLRAFVFDVLDGTKHKRIWIPNGEVTDRGEISYKNGEASSYEVTITAYPDSNGVWFKEFVDVDLTPA